MAIINETGGGVLESPAERFGFEPGTERRLIRWQPLLDYFQDLAHGSERLGYQQIGNVSGDLPFVLLTVSSPGNMKRLDHYRSIQKRLADPRQISTGDALPLIDEGRSIVLLTCSIHATEVGSTQMVPELIHELATSDSPEVVEILDNVILLVVPCLNPWGLELVADWYEETLGTPSEGCHPPEIYHPYAGHDNNRDWFMLSQVESRLTVEHVHNRWHPHVVLDQHQMMSDGPRYVLPPYIDPYDPNVDPILQAGIAQIGSAMMAEMIADGKPGVASQVIFDAFSPSRSYQHYHGGIRILTEAASCAIATTVHLERSEIREVRGFNPLRRQANNPLPWEGGDWRVRDIIEYNLASARALLRQAAIDRSRIVRNFWRVQCNSLVPSGPYAWVVPCDQSDPQAANELLQVLQRGLVEIHASDEEFEAGGVVYPAGTRVVRIGQPFGRFARTLLETQRYPRSGNAATSTPYDITSHCLPLYFGVEAVEIDDPFEADLRLVGPERLLPGAGCARRDRSNCFAIDPRQNHSFRAVNLLLDDDVPVYRLNDDFNTGNQIWPAGTFFIDADDKPIRPSIFEETGVTAFGLPDRPDVDCRRLTQPRIGLYRSWLPDAMDEGWTRFVLESYGFNFVTIRDHDIRQGELKRRYDVILLPNQSSEEVMRGNSAAEYPQEYSGGIGERGASNLRRFAESGGTVVALDAASEVAMRHLYLPVINPIEPLTESQFYCPGATLQMLVDPKHPVAWGYEREVAGLVTGRHAFSPIAENEAIQVARYPANNQLLSGWIQGANYIRGMASLVDVSVQDGRAILFGFRPQFRAQTRGTFRLLFNSLYYSTLER